MLQPLFEATCSDPDTIIVYLFLFSYLSDRSDVGSRTPVSHTSCARCGGCVSNHRFGNPTRFSFHLISVRPESRGWNKMLSNSFYLCISISFGYIACNMGKRCRNMLSEAASIHHMEGYSRKTGIIAFPLSRAYKLCTKAK